MSPRRANLTVNHAPFENLSVVSVNVSSSTPPIVSVEKTNIKFADIPSVSEAMLKSLALLDRSLSPLIPIFYIRTPILRLRDRISAPCCGFGLISAHRTVGNGIIGSSDFQGFGFSATSRVDSWGRMDSEDDMHDAYDAESLDEDFYSGGTPMGSEDGNGDYDFVDNESEDSEEITSHRQQQSYTILNITDT